MPWRTAYSELLPVPLGAPEGALPPALGLPPGPAPGPQPPAIPEGAVPAINVSIEVVPSVVAVLNATLSPTARALSVVLPFLSILLELVTAYSVVPLLVLMVTLDVPTAVTVPCSGNAAPGGAPGL